MHTKKFLCRILFICAGLILATLTFADVDVATQLQTPSNPGHPLVIDVQKNGGVAQYSSSLNVGGTPVTKLHPI